MHKAKDVVRIIGRGQAGWHANGLSPEGYRFSSSGGDLLSRPWRGTDRTVGYLAQAEDGTPVYDASGADTTAFVAWVLSSDACRLNVELNPGETDTDGNVSPDLYVRRLTDRVPGVRVGVVVGTGVRALVQWSDGTTTHYA